MRAVIASDPLMRWLSGDAQSLPVNVQDLLTDTDAEIGVSVATLYEVGLRIRQGRLDLDINEFEQLLVREGFTIIPATAFQMKRAGIVEWENLDPWDRIIAMAAIEEEAPVISPDPRFDQLGVLRVWS